MKDEGNKSRNVIARKSEGLGAELRGLGYFKLSCCRTEEVTFN